MKKLNYRVRQEDLVLLKDGIDFKSSAMKGRDFIGVLNCLHNSCRLLQRKRAITVGVGLVGTIKRPVNKWFVFIRPNQQAV